MTGVVIGYTCIITVGLLTGIMTGMTAGTMVIGMNIGLLSIYLIARYRDQSSGTASNRALEND